ncbi:endonuclease domain-containing protein [Streptosporangium sp. DT93]|uniref:endonuclease domain-containing protein n=1 Tax=Streptosporangium sp. DT93 TaxID=3393428 RepID=UPI003CEFF741
MPLSWGDLPVGRLFRLAGVDSAIDANVMELLLNPLPETGPAVVTYTATEGNSVSGVVESILRDLEILAIGLFPAWLPGGEKLSGPGGGGVAAARILAMRLASGTRHFGPFLADLAARSVQHRGPLVPGRRGPKGRSFPPESRAAGLARVIASTFGRESAALVVYVPEKPTSHGEKLLVAGCEWLAHRSGMGIWLVGPELRRVETLHLEVPAAVRRLAGTMTAPPLTATVGMPPIAGRPHPGSPVEQALEAALAECDWAHGRTWNQTYRSKDPLFIMIRTDLIWVREKCVVELDGPEHATSAHMERDRIRDRHLERDGFTVLRFTNRQVMSDLPGVLHHINEFLRARRLGTSERAG